MEEFELFQDGRQQRLSAFSIVIWESKMKRRMSDEKILLNCMRNCGLKVQCIKL